MYLKRNLLALSMLVAFLSLCMIQTGTGLVIKGAGHHGAVELLLATGILAKLLNIRAKHGITGHRILHALLGGYRYPARHALYARRPRYSPNQLLPEDALDHHAALAMPITEADLMMNEESHLLGKAQMYQMALGRPLPLVANSHVLAPSEAQLMAAELDAQELLAARRARKLLATQQARKMLADQEARKMLAREQLAASQQVLMSSPHRLMNPQQAALMGHQQARYLANVPSTKIISSTQGPVSSAQSRELILEEEIGNILARREAQQLYSNPSPDSIISASTLQQTHNGQFITLKRQDVPIYPDRLIMNLHML